MYWLASKGLPVYLPVGHSPNCDLVTEAMGRLVRVQVKTSTRWCNGRWCVTLCTKGGNRSWNGVVKHLDPRLCEYLFVHVGDGRRWLLPTSFLGGAYSVLLGGRKYGQFEIEHGEPLAPSWTVEARNNMKRASARGDVRVVKGDAL
jgi:hypothetical protein